MCLGALGMPDTMQRAPQNVPDRQVGVVVIGRTEMASQRLSDRVVIVSLTVTMERAAQRLFGLMLDEAVVVTVAVTWWLWPSLHCKQYLALLVVVVMEVTVTEMAEMPLVCVPRVLCDPHNCWMRPDSQHSAVCVHSLCRSNPGNGSKHMTHRHHFHLLIFFFFLSLSS